MISRSPQRHTFQKESYIKRCKEKGLTPNKDYLDMFQKILEQEKDKWSDPKKKENNLEWDLLTTDWILQKVRDSRIYSQNLYAALCNNEFQKLEVIPILKDHTWGCSWRYAGGIISDMRQEGDYIDWYCSGIQADYDNSSEEEIWNFTDEQHLRYRESLSFVPEGTITNEIREDLKILRWVVIS